MTHTSIFNHLYSLTLQRKKELSKNKGYSIVKISDSDLEKNSYFDFIKNRKSPLVNQTVIYLYENIIRNSFVNSKLILEPNKIYSALELYNLTKVSLILLSNTKLVDPRLLSLYITGPGNIVIKVDANINNVTVVALSESLMYNVYTTNIDIPINSKYHKSYIVMTDGIIEWNTPTVVNDQYYISLTPPVGKISVVIMAESLRLFKITPVDNGIYKYLPINGQEGFMDVNSTRLFNLSQVNTSNYMTKPTDDDFTPLYDGFKVDSMDERILVNFTRTDVTIPLYKDLRHHYDLYRDYMDEYTNNTLPDFIKNYTPYVPDFNNQLDTPSTFRLKMTEASKDFINEYKKFLEEMKSYQLTTHQIDSNTPIILNRNPKDLLFFIDGLNVNPIKSNWIGNGKYEAYFKASDITSNTIYSIDIGKDIEPYVEGKTLVANNVIIGPSSKLDSTDIRVYQVSDSSGKIFNEILPELYSNINAGSFSDTSSTTNIDAGYFLSNPSPQPNIDAGTFLDQPTQTDTSTVQFTVVDDHNIKNINFDSSYIGKNIYVCTQNYNKVIQNPSSICSLIEVPFWSTFIDYNDIHIFMNGRLISRDKRNVYNTFQYRMLRGKTVVGINYDADVVNGEHITALITNQMELIEYEVQLTDGDKIIELIDKKYPFSNKYNLIFINGKFIHPSSIKEIDTYKFSINTDSVKDMCIFRPKFIIPNSDLLVGIEDKWTEYLSTLTVTEIESLIGLLNTVSNSVSYDRQTEFDIRVYYDILYNYCLKDKHDFINEDNLYIKEDIPQVLLPDGRLPISTIRQNYARYKL